MQEIKFRGISKKTNKFVYGGYCSELVGRTEYYYIIERNGYKHEIIKDSIGQYTGLKTETGKEIYEGDVLYYDWKGQKFTGVVIFEYSKFRVKRNTRRKSTPQAQDLFGRNDGTIVGNIYENPKYNEFTVEKDQ